MSSKVKFEKVWHTNPDGSKVCRFRYTCSTCGKSFTSLARPQDLTNGKVICGKCPER